MRTRGAGEPGPRLPFAEDLLLIAVLLLVVLVSALAMAPGFPYEKALWMYIESAKPTVLAA